MHWISSIMIITALIVGIYMTSIEPSDFKWTLYSFHKSLGMYFMLFVIARIILRTLSRIPNMPTKISQVEILLSKIGVLCLYLMMLAMPISGYIMSSASGKSIPLLWGDAPNIIAPNPTYAKIGHFLHVNLWYIMIILIALHALFAIKHLVIDRINLLQRMWF